MSFGASEIFLHYVELVIEYQSFHQYHPLVHLHLKDLVVLSKASCLRCHVYWVLHLATFDVDPRQYEGLYRVQ